MVVDQLAETVVLEERCDCRRVQNGHARERLRDRQIADHLLVNRYCRERSIRGATIEAQRRANAVEGNELFQPAGEALLVRRSEQWNLVNLLQVHADRIV